jgi:DNA processing protein
LVTEASDLIDALQPILGHEILGGFGEPEPVAPASPDADPAGDARARIVALLGPTPVSLDDLVRLAQSSPAIVRVVLLELDLAGRLQRHRGGLVSLV